MKTPASSKEHSGKSTPRVRKRSKGWLPRKVGEKQATLKELRRGQGKGGPAWDATCRKRGLVKKTICREHRDGTVSYRVTWLEEDDSCKPNIAGNDSVGPSRRKKARPASLTDHQQQQIDRQFEM